LRGTTKSNSTAVRKSPPAQDWGLNKKRAGEAIFPPNQENLSIIISAAPVAFLSMNVICNYTHSGKNYNLHLKTALAAKSTDLI